MKIVNVWLLAMLLTIFFRSAFSAEYTAGDLAPRGAPDGVLDVADILVMQQFYLGATAPTGVESLIGDVAPLNNPDGQIDVADILVLQRAINGDVLLNPIIVLPPAPALNPVASPVNQNSVVVSGVAQNNTSVRIYKDNLLVITLTSSAVDGSFSTPVTLDLGTNNIHATEWDGVSESGNSNTVSIDYVLPVPVLDTIPATTTSNGVTVSGTVSSGDVVKLFVNGVEFAQTNIVAGGFQFNNVVLNVGSNSIYAVVSMAGVDGPQSTAEIIDYSFTTPSISDPGNSANANPYTINGSADANTEIRIYLNGDYQQTITTDGLGIFSVGVFLTHGSNTITARAWDGYIETAASNSIASSYTDSTPRNLNQSGIGSDTVWTPGPTNAPYVITRYFIVPSGVTLTIMPGTRIEYNATTENIGFQVQGTLRVLGSAASPVVFTSAELVPAAGDWPGVMFTGTSVNSDIQHATFEYARNAVWVWTNGETNVHDSLFTNFSNAGVYADQNSSGIVDNNIFDNIDQLPTGSVSLTTIGSAIQMRSSNFVVSNNQVMRTNLGIFQTGGTSVISGNSFSNMPNAIWLYQSGDATINQGNVFTGLDVGIYMTGDTVGGTNPQPVINNNSFTGNLVLDIFADDFVNGASNLIDATQNWWDDTDPRTIIQRIADSQGGTFFILNNPPTINYGSYLNAAGGQPVFDNWLFEDITANTTLNAGERYEVFTDINVSSAATLTIPAGTELHFVHNDALTVDGGLDVQGMLLEPVVFTSNANGPGAGSWQGVLANSASSNINIDYAQINYASTALHFVNGQANVLNSLLSQNQVAIQYESGVTGSVESNSISANVTGIRLNGASPDIRSNTIQNHNFGIYLTQGASPVIENANVITGNVYGVYSSGDGVQLANNPVPVISNNDIYSNSAYNLFTNNYVAADSTVIDAQENWWGVGNAVSVAATIYDHDEILTSPLVDYGRYLDQQGGTPVYQNSLIGAVASDLDIQQNETYEVIGDLTIESGTTVTMAAGSQLIFPNNSQLVVNGVLSATGASGSHVVLTSTATTPSMGSWQGVLVGPGGNLTLNYVSIQYADRGVDMQSASGVISNVDIADSSYGIYLSASSPTVTSSSIHNNTYGVYITGLSDPVINGNNDISLNQYGLYVVGGSLVTDENPNPIVTGNAIHQNSTFNYFADNFFNPSGLMLDATANYWGNADPLVVETTVRDYMDDSANAPFVDYGHYLDSVAGVIVKQNYLLGYISGVIIDTSASYEVLSDIFVSEGQTLELQQGVQIEFLADYRLIVDGVLLVQGAQNNPVLFTSGESVQNIGDWRGIQVNATSIGSSFDYVEIEYSWHAIEFNGASGTVTHSNLHNNSHAIYVTGANADPVINNQNVIVNNTYGIYVEGQALAGTNPNPIVNGNAIHSNSTYNYQAVNFHDPTLTILDATNNWWNLTAANEIANTIRDQMDQATSPYVNYGQYLDVQDGVPIYANSLLGPVSGTIDTASGTDYELLGDILIPSGQSLTIAAGVNLLAVDNVAFNVDGNLFIQGTELSPVHISAISSSAGAWDGIYLNQASATVNIDWAHIENADYGLYFNSSGASGLITHSTIENNTRGIYIYGVSSPVINASNTIRNNQYGIYIEGTGVAGDYPTPVINDNQIYDNTSYSVYTSSFVDTNYPVVNLNSNFWGSTDVNNIAADIYDVGDNAVSRPIVDFGGYYHIPGAQADSRQLLLTGKINQNTTISADSNYLVTYNLIVEAGSTLTIEQGVELYFLNSKGITVHGTLNINGLSTNRVILTSANQFLTATQYYWNGIRVENDPGSVNIDYAVVSHASYGVYFNAASGSVTNSIFTNNQYAFYVLNNSNPIIDSNSIVENLYGIALVGSVVDPGPNIINNDIFGNSFANLYLQSIDTSTILNVGNNWWGTGVVADIRNTISVSGGSDQAMSVLLDAVSSQLNQIAIPTSIVVSEQYISPAESVGVQDSVNLSASLGQTSAWSVDIMNSAGQVVRNYSGSGTSVNISWDGQDGSSQNVADGAYTFMISVANTQVKQVRSVVVDNLLPSGSFAAGLDGSTIDASSLSINGTATDNFFLNYQLEHGAGVSPSTWTSIDGVKTSQVLSGNLVNWVLNSSSGLAPPPNGTNTLRLTVTDQAGNSTVQTIQVTLNTLAIYTVSHDMASIHPVQGEMATISFNLNNPATVTLQIVAESDGSVVRNISQSFASSGNYSLVWDGKDDTDSHVQNEAYIYTLLADDGVRQASYSPTFNSVVGSISGSSLIGYSVSKNEFWKNNTNVSSAGRVRLCIGTNTSPPTSSCSGTGHFAAIDEIPYEAGSHWLYWNGRLPNGDALKSKDYRFFLSVPETLPPNTIIVKGNTPTLQGEAAVAPNIEIKSNPYKVRHSYDEFSVINYEVDQDAYVTVKLLPPGINDPADPSAITITNNQLQSAESSPGVPQVHGFNWKGYDDSVASPDTNNILVSTNGRYTFTIEATSVVTGFSTLYRGSLRLYH